ncbi:hypothetical protein [Methanohalophilus sp. WG1-DM]|jgi:hypothetical protein|uniref:hypothetical protein n=1 Tax=Methanohalophilus sp. WG1-DM TaxID=2491675 RepID=UPI000FFEA977|nr:hypothetical protein [Methanohalophilus sp. WG1-DM]RXG34180.1 hypothetical protein CI957_1088 [Methanohalophilus sp. WG1-DM]
MDIYLATLLPNTLFNILPALTLIAIGAIVEKYYVGRIAIFSNAVALTSFYYTFSDLPFLLVIYINILTVVGILSLASYLSKTSLPTEFYTFSGLFSSLVSGMVLLYGLTL